MRIESLSAAEDNFIVNIRKKTAFLSSMKKIMFFDDATRKIRKTCKISTSLEDLNFLNPRSHLNRKSVETARH